MRLTLVATIAAGWLGTAQPAPQDPAVADVRQTLDTARKAVEAYKTAGGAPGAADHPAITWDAALWAYRDKYPRTEASAIGTAEAVRLLVRAELWDRARARVESVGFEDAAWERLPAILYEKGIARKDLPAAIDRLSRATQSATTPVNKSVALLVLGRAYRRQGDKESATRSLEAAKAAAPASRYADEADGLIYEIAHLSPGLPAPAIAAKTLDGRDVSLAALRGKPVVLVFWGTT